MTLERENFAKYKVESVLGEGAMGVVYAGYDSAIGRRVAIKTIHSHLLQGAEGEELRQRFTREIRAVGKLSHPNIVGIFDTDEAEDASGAVVPYFVMEFVEGKDLQEHIAAGSRFPLAKIIDIACQILDAFEYTHKLGVVHRDVKPANVFLTDDGRVKIADFGIARVDNSSLTQTGAVMGTPNYMSPEQCSGQVMDSRSDLFSIAVVLYELLTGEKAFSGNSVHATMMKLVQTNPEPPSVFNPSLPKSLDAVIVKALSKSPDERFQSAAEFASALEPFRTGSSKGAKEAAVSQGDETLLAPQPGVKPQNVNRSSEDKRARPKALLGGIAAALLLIGGVGFYVLSGTTEPEPVQLESVEPFAGDLTPATQEKVEKLLRVAAMHETANRLVFPPGSSAYYVYNTVFELDPGNPRARAGLSNIESVLEKQAQDYYRQKDFKTLQAHLKAGLEAFPENDRFQSLQRELDRLGTKVSEK